MDYIDRHPTESGIIYCSTRKNVDNLFELLFQKGVAVTRYHAGLNNETRKRIRMISFTTEPPLLLQQMHLEWGLINPM